MLEDTGSLCADFLCTDRAGNVGLVNLQLSAVALPNQIADVFGVVGDVYKRQVLDQHISDVPHDGFLSAIYSTHPCNDDRVAALQNLGVPYSRY